MGTLVLMRHAESEWNAKGLFAGWADVKLAPNGLQEAEGAAGCSPPQGCARTWCTPRC